MKTVNFVIFLVSFLSQIGTSQLHFKGSVSFISDAPLEIIKAKSTELFGDVDFANQAFTFGVKLKTLRGFNSKLQEEHFHENYLETNRFPVIRYKGKLIDKFDPKVDGTYIVRSKGIFLIHGIEKERILKNTVQIVAGKISVSNEFELLLSDFDIDIPKVVNKKISEKVKIIVSANSI